MQSSQVFSLWPRLHGDLLSLLDRVPNGDLGARAAGFELDLGASFRHLAAVERYWRGVILERTAVLTQPSADDHPDVATTRALLSDTFAATERLLDGSRVDALLARPVASSYPVRNGLEALQLALIQTVHHRALIAAQLRALGTDPGDWL